MKRSQVNTYIKEAISFMKKNNFYIPDWAYWNQDDWSKNKNECTEIFDNSLGWDITDFGHGDFLRIGLTLITLRNGNLNKPSKPYCEKIMYVRENQVTPLHYHILKTEDIINRGGGVLCMRLWKSSDNKLDNSPIEIKIDGITKVVNAGEVIKIYPGQSICYFPYLYHTFWAEEGDCLVGEVSCVNDDNTDNVFLEDKGRYSKIENDVNPEFILCNEYSNFIK
jgi:ABC-type sugar transport system, auxiliary component